jgi:hypothetical protein
VFAIELALCAYDVRGGRLKFGLEAAGGGMEGSVVDRADVNRNARQPKFACGFDSVSAAGDDEALSVNDLRFEPMINAGWREEVMVGVADGTGLRVGAGAHLSKVFLACAVTELAVHTRKLSHVRPHLLGSRLGGACQPFIDPKPSRRHGSES